MALVLSGAVEIKPNIVVIIVIPILSTTDSILSTWGMKVILIAAKSIRM